MYTMQSGRVRVPPADEPRRGDLAARRGRGLAAARRRPQPAADDEAAAGEAGRARRHRAASPGSTGSRRERRPARSARWPPTRRWRRPRSRSGSRRSIPETAALIGDRQVRNRGTIGGSVAHADPGADYPTVLKALGATITATGTERRARDRRRRLLPRHVRDGARARRARHVGAACRRPAAGTGAAYVKHAHPASRLRGRRRRGRGRRSRAASAPSARLVVGGVTAPPVRRDRGRSRSSAAPAPTRRSPQPPRRCRRRSRTRSATRTRPASTGRTSPRCSRSARSGRPSSGPRDLGHRSSRSSSDPSSSRLARLCPAAKRST